MKALNYEAAATALAGFTALVGVVGWQWNTRNIATNARDDLAALIAERERDKVTWGARLAKVELAAAALDRLTDAVKAGNDMAAERLANLADKFTDHATFTKEQLAEIRSEQKAVRSALSAHDGALKRSG